MLNVNNIQRLCFHDGPGIRTTVFLNFCTLNCPWCANPETSKYNKKYIINENCNNEICPYGFECNGFKSTIEQLKSNYNNCPIEAIDKNENLYSVDDLYDELVKDKHLYKNVGGVTFSGGEPLIQAEELSKIIKKLKKDNINITLESCLFVPIKNLNLIIDDVDLFIIDIKILNKIDCMKILNGDIDLFLKNIDLIFKKNKKVIFRIPLIVPYIANEKNLNDIYRFISKFKPTCVEIFKGHNLAEQKYLKLKLNYDKVKTVSDEEIEKIKKYLEKCDVNVNIIKY